MSEVRLANTADAHFRNLATPERVFETNAA
jgi:hypothetical protein